MGSHAHDSSYLSQRGADLQALYAKAVEGSSSIGAAQSAITVKGQATIPKAIREHLGLKAGDRLKFFLHPDGTVALLPKLPARALRGMAKFRRGRAVTIAQMTRAAAEGASGATGGKKRR